MPDSTCLKTSEYLDMEFTIDAQDVEIIRINELLDAALKEKAPDKEGFPWTVALVGIAVGATAVAVLD